ncbi:MAG: aminotransferase class V-fold PLP-dependent enzyme [Gemmatimonadota bacterium]
MTLSRRQLLAGLGGEGLTAALGPVERTPSTGSAITAGPLPARADFTIPDGQAYLNSAFIHPMPRGAAEAARRYLEQRALKAERRKPVSWTMHQDATGHFEAGTFSQSAAVCLSSSLPYIQRIGVSAIEAYRQPMLLRLRQELSRLGWQSITPEGTTSALIAFYRKGAEQEFSGRLQRANVQMSLSRGRLRVSPSVFNTMGDVEQLLEALSHKP